MHVDDIAALLASSRSEDRVRAYHLAGSAPDTEAVQVNALLDEVGPPADPGEADLFWATSNRLTRRCFLASAHSAQAHVDQMPDDVVVAVTGIFLATADGSEREAEFLDALLPLALPALGLDVLLRPLPATVRARVFAHFIELESQAGLLAGPATMALSEEPGALVALTNELIHQRTTAQLAALVEDA